MITFGYGLSVVIADEWGRNLEIVVKFSLKSAAFAQI